MTDQRFPEQRFPEDVDYDDLAIGEMLREAHRVQVDHCEREGLSFGLSSSSMSQDRTRQPVVEGHEQIQGSTFDTNTRRKLVEDQDTILEVTGKIQELQSEIDCMNDLRDFQDAESVRSGNSHVTNRPVSFPPHPIPEGILSRSIGMPSRREGPAKHLGHAWYIGKRFCRSSCVFYSTLSAGIESMECRHVRTDSLING